jgi:hypothetical protein
MKNLKDIRQVSHYWANRTLESGKASGLSFEGDTLFSYAEPIAKLLPDNTVIHTTRKWSVTTSNHQSLARSATNYSRGVWCRRVQDTPAWNMDQSRRYIAELLADAQKPLSLKKDGKPTVASIKNRDNLQAEALREADQANAYLEACQRNGLGLEQQPIDTSNLEGIREEMQRALDAAAAAQAERQRLRAIEAVEDLALWRQGQPCQRGRLGDLPVALRLTKKGWNAIGHAQPETQIVETSHGAEIPVEHALELWPAIQAVKQRGSGDLAPRNRTLGHYTLNLIRADGSIKVGCHDIAYSEIEGIAKALHLTTEGGQ